ncbi:MAG TPA: arsenite methyltransferase [Sulfuricaulis sp.]|nr:arsenite methyltransferase [Sulfuricaulis sp.]
MSSLKQDEIRQAVRQRYAEVAQSGAVSDCGPSCCGTGGITSAAEASVTLGYSQTDVTTVPDGANMGLGCGNPQAIAAIKPGETVLDLGSGGGFDCFLAARQTGNHGHVIGVDMTPVMISKARANAVNGGYHNVEFRLGEIENLPLADDSVDVIISNCVINLSPDKERVFKETFRVLKPGGRLAISDVVATAALPEAVQRDMTLYTGCMAGASLIGEIEGMLASAGFVNIRLKPKDASRSFIRDWAPGSKIEDYVVSATIEAMKPRSE